jgi:hypothetical protein
MTPDALIDLLAKLEIDLQRAENGLPILMQRERAVATREALHAVDQAALVWTGGAA